MSFGVNTGLIPEFVRSSKTFITALVVVKVFFLCSLPKKREEYQVSFSEFMRIGIPYTLVAVLTGYLYLWFVWA